MSQTDGVPSGGQALISADSHVFEPFDLWEKGLPARFRDQVIPIPDRRAEFPGRPGGTDPVERLKDMAADGVVAEVLYPTRANNLYRYTEPAMQAACARVYNDWMIDYCSAAPERLWGLGIISLWDIDGAIAELARCRTAGLPGATIWLIPPDELPWASGHYERFWAAAQEMEMPVGLHILAGYGHYQNRPVDRSMESRLEQQRSGNLNKLAAENVLLDLIGTGVLERYPQLKIVIAEVGAGWVPFWLQETDYQFQLRGAPAALSLTPSGYFARQVYVTFMDDAVAGRLLSWWCKDRLLWGSDYPHPNGTWPKSRELLARTLGHLSPDDQTRATRLSVADLYGKSVTPLLEAPGSAVEPGAWLSRARIALAPRTEQERP